MACVDLLKIVSQNSYTGRTSSLGATTQFTPSADGNFMLMAYIEGDTTNGGSIDVEFSYSDNNGSSSQPGGTLNSGQVGNANKVSFVHAVSGQAISVSATVSSGTVTYSLFVVVVQL